MTDGRDIYFLELVGGHQSLARVPASGGDSTLLTTSLDNLQLADISPDGRELLVGTRRGHTVGMAAVENLTGCWNARDPARFASRSCGHLLSGRTDRSHTAVGHDLYLANSDGSQPRLLTSTAGVARWIRWSPDGSVIRFTLLNPQNRTSALWEVASSGRNLRPLLPGWNDPSWECCGNWTSDGSYFVFQSTRNWASQIWAIREKVGTVQEAGSTPVQLTSGPVSYRARYRAVMGDEFWWWRPAAQRASAVQPGGESV